MKKIKVCVVGLGYVGLPLAHAFSSEYKVVGLDIDEVRISELLSGYDRTLELTDGQVQETIDNGIFYTSSYDDASDSNIYIVTVPTPIDNRNNPNLNPLKSSSLSVATVLSKGDIVIYESTVYPGATEDVCVPILEDGSGLIFNVDFYCGYSPERINPGDKEHTVTNILKVTSGSTPDTARIVDGLYKSIVVAGTHLAPSIKVAEASKLMENTQRDVNIAFMNEMAMICNKMAIDTNDVIDAASTKWNFHGYTPGIVGGHCIGTDPYYLIYRAREVGYEPHLILNSRKINNYMSKYIVGATIKEMINGDIKIKESNALVLGVTFKENCPDMRNTRVVDIIEGLKEYGVNVDVYDPWVNWDVECSWYTHGHICNPMNNKKVYDSVIVAVAHDEFKKYTMQEYNKITTSNRVIIDVKNLIKDGAWKL